MNNLPLNTRLQNGAFTVGKVLGQGGFGITYQGADMNLRRLVAIKEFFPEGCVRQGNSVSPRAAINATEYSSAKSKFIEEARTLARFHHPGIVAVHTFFEENNTAYMVMEYLKGKTLAQLVAESGALPESEAIGHIQKIGEALEELHRFQLLHRDVKPENAIVCEDGRVVLIDFGLTKKVEEVIGLGTRQLAATTRFGSDGFAPPEQYLRSGVLGKYTDVYALGATLYFLLTGTIPISAPERAMGGVLMPIHQTNPSISRSLSDAAENAMELDKDKRPRSVQCFIELIHKLSTTISPSSGKAPTSVSPPHTSIPTNSIPNTTPRPVIQGVHQLGQSVRGYAQGLLAICPYCLSENIVPDDTLIGNAVRCCSCSERFNVSSVNKKVKTLWGTSISPAPTLKITEVGKIQLDLPRLSKHSHEVKIASCTFSDGFPRVHIIVTRDNSKSPEVICTDKAGLAKLRLLIETAEKLIP
jgi:serine/threonine-protein kinase